MRLVDTSNRAVQSQWFYAHAAGAICPGGVPPKRVNKANRDFLLFICFLENVGAVKLGSVAYETGPNWYRKVDEV